MDNAYKSLQSPEMWIVAIFIGVIVNLLSYCIRKFLSSRSSKIFSWWQRRSEERAKRQEQYIVKMTSDFNYLSLQAIIESRYRSYAVVNVLFSIIAFQVAELIGLPYFIHISFHLISAIALLLGLRYLSTAFKLEMCITAATEKRQTEKKE